MKSRFLFSFLFIASAVFFAGADAYGKAIYLGGAPFAGRITGTVIDRDAGTALPGANVIIQGTSTGAATDENGVFTLNNVPAGTVTLTVSYIGYQTASREIFVIDGQTVEANFELVWEGVQGEEVVITAQAAGQTAAINQQLSSNTITNIVSAARIQELPDVNAAESAGRLPGVSIQRSGGEANKVVIRGLSPKYNTVTVNGVRVPSTSGNDRSADLSLISSSMLDGIEVMKAITPDKDADAIGGSVDLKLREAPDELMIDLLGQGGYNQLQDYYGNYKFVSSVGYRFFNKKLGVIASLNKDEFDRSADKFSGGYRQDSDPATGAPIILISGITAQETNVKRGRTGASAVLDFRLPNGKVTANSFFNERTFDGLTRGNEMAIDQNRLRYSTRLGSGNTSIFTGAFGIEQTFNKFSYDVGVSRIASRRDNPSFFWLFHQQRGSFTAAPDENTHPTEIPALANVDSLATGLHEVFVNDVRLEEDETAFQLNLKRSFYINDFLSGYVKAGGKLRWLERFNDQSQAGSNGIYSGSGGGSLNKTLECAAAALPDWDLDNIVGELGVLPVGLVDTDYTRDDFLEGEYPLGFTVDTDMMLAFTRAIQQCPNVYRDYSLTSLGRDYTGKEQYQAGYIMAELNIGPRITIIPGVRWESDYSRYNGQRFREIITNNVSGPPADLTPVTNIRENSFWLPMVHLRYEPTDWLTLRFARTETLTRPDYIQYAPVTSINNTRTNVNAANGLLRPAKSINYDAALSVYNNKIGLFTVSGFQKSIDDLILFVQYILHRDVGTLPGMNVPDEWWIEDAAPRVSSYINNPFAAKYKGFEIDWQTNFWYLPSFLKGLVLSANYTYLQSETTYQAYFTVDSDSLIRRRPPVYLKVLKTDSTRTARMPDQPTHIANVTVGYDFKGFSARFSMLYQTDTSTSINATNALFDSFSGDYLRYDLSLRQKLPRGLEVFANFNNLSSRPDRNFRGAVDANPSFIEYYGFTMDVGARFRY